MKYFFPILSLLLLTGCAGDDFDPEAFPPDQISAEMAYKRLSDHGDLEPVLREGQLVDGWQFFVVSRSETSLAGGQPMVTLALKDRSGITYSVTSGISPEVIDKIEMGTYGFGRGRVHAVTRDLVAGKIEAELLLSDWTVRKD